MPSTGSGEEVRRAAGSRGNNTRRAAARRKGRKRSKGQKQFRDLTMEAVVMLLLFILCFFMVLGSYDTGGSLGRILGTMEWGLFGVLCHFFPLVLYFGAAFLLENRFRPLAYKKMAGLWGFYFCLCGFWQRFTDGYLPSYSVMDYYARSADYHVAGGAFGGILCMTLTSAFGMIFGVVVLVLLTLCCVIILTQRSLVDFILDITDFVMGLGPGLSEEEREAMREEKERIRAEKLEAKIARENASFDFLVEQEEEKLRAKEARREEKAKKAQEERENKAKLRAEAKERREALKAAKRAAMEAEMEAEGEEGQEGEESLPGHPELDLKAKFSPQIFGFRRRIASAGDEENLLTPEGEEEAEEELEEEAPKKEKKSRTLGLRSFVSELRRGLEDDDDEDSAPEEEGVAVKEETISDAYQGTDMGEEPSTFDEAKKAKALASQKNPSAGEDPMQLGDIGLIDY